MADRKLFAVYQTKTVLTPSNPIALDPTTEVWSDVYGIDLAGVLKADDYVKVFASEEFTNDAGFNVGIVTCLTLDAAAPPANAPISPTGCYLSPPAGDDVGTDGAHHCYRVLIGGMILADDAYGPAAHFRLRVADQSTAATPSSTPVAIMPQGYGSMTLEIYR